MNEKYLVGVSGGCDSMALLDILFKENKNLIVCHVNYNSRDSSYRDEQIVKKYCDERNIVFHLLKAQKHKKTDGNFENWARIIRYSFFSEVYNEYNCKALFIGHHQDDLLETYHLQKNRDIECQYYGIKKENNLYGMNVVRPLLETSRNQLEEYCIKNKIEFGEDETNLDFKYERNKYRHNILKKLSEEEKKEIVEEIKKKNDLKENEIKHINDLKVICIKSDKINLLKFNEFKEYEKTKIVYDFVISKFKKKLSISKARIMDLIKKIDSKKPNIVLWEEENILLCKEYDFLCFREKVEDYSYLIEESINKLDYKEISICEEGNKKDLVIVKKDDFPLIIRNANKQDKRANKIFIKNKIPFFERQKWPVIINKNAELLLVLGLDMSYNNKVANKENIKKIYIKRKRGI